MLILRLLAICLFLVHYSQGNNHHFVDKFDAYVRLGVDVLSDDSEGV